ncbi:right-handed parallel beta-helix repeat-containing protein [Kitasatospora sp. MAP5-34]|uniref:PKD domain-containing protein n=1 Tax=Kitasatospora sp. MAP5-34 TaxID=3035102 RepID=UPI002474371F|nr:right-handed parallel beta-helix repeat-containing protein [Kitasatospora sp. MAP5-34]MDH6576318.1 parallel beta-helix repeat protein [Kitasatospora sp. MAP5-34]
MSIRRRAGLATVAAAVVAGVVMPIPAFADTSTTLFVDNTPGKCSDAGQGTAALPFCTVQAAADIVQAGQTVQVAAGPTTYPEQVTVKNSGTPGHPITFKGDSTVPENMPQVGLDYWQSKTKQGHGFVLSGVHDVTVQNFVFDTPQEAVLVTDSDRITIDHNLSYNGTFTNSPGIRLSGRTTDSVVSRNQVGDSGFAGIAVDKGVTGTVVTTNALSGNQGAGIVVTDAPGTVVTSNTLKSNNGRGISLAGDSSGATVENNIITGSDFGSKDPAHAVELSVSAGSVSGTKVDYNVVRPTGTGTGYAWGADVYPSPAAFHTATGQGSHDLNDNPQLPMDLTGNSTVVPLADSPATDSADALAPGELSTDLMGNPRVDDLNRANTGTGNGFYDRGAIELQPFKSFQIRVDNTYGPHPMQVTAKVQSTRNWPDTVTYSFDFGDGSDPVATNSPQAAHSYTAKGAYLITVTATGVTDGSVTKVTTSSPVTVNDPGPVVPQLEITPADRNTNNGPLSFMFNLDKSAAPYRLKSYRVDYGDGTPASVDNPISYHNYAKPGDYTVTATVTDESGAQGTVTKTVHAAYPTMGFTPITPFRVLDTRKPQAPNFGGRVGQGQSVDVNPYISIPSGMHPAAVVLNVTAVNGDKGGYLTVYPRGAQRPTTSNVNFTAGQNASNLVTVPLGDGEQLSVFNHTGNVDVVMDVVGFYQGGTGDRFTTAGPARLLDTRRKGGTALGPDGSTSIQVRGVNGVPANATTAVLNLTVTGADTGGYLTTYPSGTARPGTSNLNFTAGQTVPNQVVVPIGADGKVTLYNHTGNTDVVADLFGYYSPTGDSLFTPVIPTRLVDTRIAKSTLGPDSTLTVPTGTPAGTTGAVLNVISTGSTTGGYLTVWADGTDKPGTSNLNFTAGQTVPNHVTTPVGTNGNVDVYNHTGNTDVVADLFGYFSKSN